MEKNKTNKQTCLINGELRGYLIVTVSIQNIVQNFGMEQVWLNEGAT